MSATSALVANCGSIIDRLHHYIVQSLLTGARTEELRAFEWQHVHLDTPPLIPHVEA